MTTQFNPISFPGLGLGPFDPNPTMFTVMGHNIQWYGFIIAMGFLLAALYVFRRSAEVGISGDTMADALFFAVPIAIIGGRAYYVIFYWSLFAKDPINALYIWQGGMAIYGAIIAAFITCIIFSRIRKISAYALLDIGVLGVLIGQCIGRWANFFNREAYGSQTTFPWRMELFSWTEMDRIQVHPTFLYESLWTLIGFILLHILLTRRKYDGQILLGYVAWYGFGRGFIEGLRTDSLYLFNTGLRVSQLLAFASCAISVGFLVFFHFNPPAKPLYVTVVKAGAEAEAAGKEADSEPTPTEETRQTPEDTPEGGQGTDDH